MGTFELTPTVRLEAMGKALIEIEKEPWAKDMARLLRMACHAANQARRREVAGRLP